MNFFELQHRARRKTRLLLVLFAVATLLIVAAVDLVVAGLAVNLWNPDVAAGLAVNLWRPIDGLLLPNSAWFHTHALLMGISTTTTMVIILAGTVFKMLELRTGGGQVARAMGGTPIDRSTDDPGEKRLLNVLDEMSIAAGVPAPEAYVLDRELGINAFAAGFTSADAAIGVTRGTLERLSRDELQGVIAHEYSHILNGDMRLNMETMGILHGILIIGLTGEALLRLGAGVGPRDRDGESRRRGRGAGLAVVAAGAALMAIGQLGTFFGTLIKAGMSRQREFLADASAVQFTRNPQGIVGALKKIGGFSEHSWLRSHRASEISHMLFGDGAASLFSLLATHPPLTARILAIDPSFDVAAYEAAVAESMRQPRDLQEELVMALRGDSRSTGGNVPVELSSDGAFTAHAGQPTAAHLAYSARLLARLPTTLRDATGFPDEAEAVVVASLLTRDPEPRSRQLDIVRASAGEERRAQVVRIRNELDQQGDEVRLPLLDLSMPALRRRRPEQVDALLKLCTQLIGADGVIEPFEYSLQRVLRCHLIDAADLSGAADRARELRHCASAASVLITVVAKVGHDDASVIKAFRCGMAELGMEDSAPASAEFSKEAMDSALDELDRLAAPDKQRLIEALYRTVAYDRRVSVVECELLRAICASLHVPIPPLAAGDLRAYCDA